MNGLVIRRPCHFPLTFYEQMLCRGALQCDPPAFAAISRIYEAALIRSFGIPASLLGESSLTSYSSGRYEPHVYRREKAGDA
jgi:hypothetical protein